VTPGAGRGLARLLLCNLGMRQPVGLAVAASLLFGCNTPEPRAPEPEPPWVHTPSAPAPPPVARTIQPHPWGSQSDNTAELYSCLGPDACPGTLEDRARSRAAAAFACAPEEVTMAARPTRGLGVHAPQMVFGKEGQVQVQVQTRAGEAFTVAGCGQQGILACVWANRSVHTSTTTYENTEDRLCLWAD